MRTVDKAEAVELLARHRRQLKLADTDCVMCALVAAAARAPADFVAESADGVVLVDRFGNQPGHLLVIARAHVEDTLALGWERYQGLQRLAYRATQALTSVLSPLRVYIAALGASSPLPMSFPHFHIHLIPVYHDDERARPAQVFSWTSGVVVYDDAEARELAERLRAAFAAGASP